MDTHYVQLSWLILLRVYFYGCDLELSCGRTPKKEINRSPFRHTESYKQSQKKINTLQETEQGSTEESGARAPISQIQSF